MPANDPARIPTVARAGKSKPAASGAKADARPGRGTTFTYREDVFAAYNARTTLDEVVAWHVAQGHRVTRREDDRVELVRAGKDGTGQSLNVKLTDGVPLTFNFSNAADLPVGQGLTPSQVRCWYETGGCDTSAMAAFAARLRVELGWDQSDETSKAKGETSGHVGEDVGDESGAGDEKPPKASAATVLIELAEAAGVVLSHAPDREAFARVPCDGHLEVYPVRGTQFRRYLTGLYFTSERKGVGGDAMATALGTLDAMAVFDGPEVPVFIRVAPVGGGVAIDLCDDAWRAVVVRASGWEVCDASPVLFRRSPTMRRLPVPARGGRLTDLRRFLNLRSDDDWLLVAAWLAAALRPAGPYPILHPKGEPGTAKTTFGRIVRGLVDPNELSLRSQPRDERDLAVSSRQGWAIGFDNLSAIPVWLSDALCRVATGGGFGTRALYSNDEEAAFSFVRPVLITSIEDVLGQPDLLDRSLAIELEPIPDQRRKTEAALWAEFDAAAPGIFGGLLDVLARALELLPAVTAEGNPAPRMADFAVFGEAVARALGAEPGRFLSVLFSTRKGADQSALEGSVLAKALYEWIRSRGTFSGTYTVLLAELNESAAPDMRKARGWPPTANALSGHVRRIAPAIRRLGVTVGHDRTGHEKTRTVTLTYGPGVACSGSSASSAGPGNAQPNKDLGADDPGDPPPSSARNPKSDQDFRHSADDADDLFRGSRVVVDHPISGPVTEELL